MRPIPKPASGSGSSSGSRSTGRSARPKPSSRSSSATRNAATLSGQTRSRLANGLMNGSRKRSGRARSRPVGTYQHYRSTIARYLKPKLGMIPLQQLKAQDLKRHYTEMGQGEQPLTSGNPRRPPSDCVQLAQGGPARGARHQERRRPRRRQAATPGRSARCADALLHLGRSEHVAEGGEGGWSAAGGPLCPRARLWHAPQ